MHARPALDRLIKSLVCALALTGTAPASQPARTTHNDRAREILEAAGVPAGLVVHLRCDDGKLTAALGAGKRYLVHGLDTDPTDVAAARRHIQSLGGSCTNVSVDEFDGRRLPLIDNLANLVVAEGLGEVSMAEVMRVVCPGGAAYIGSNGRWTRTVKPRPAAMDQWTHYLHDPQGTMVGRDRIVGPPRRLQWMGGPKWMRNHDFMASLTGMVSSAGRLFYVIDEGLRNHVYLPARWTVVARDAFNGTVLWKRPMGAWFPHTWPFKSGPGHLPRRIVAHADRVYVTLGITSPLSVLDAATGETVQTFERTKATEEIVLDDGLLFLVVDPSKGAFPYQHASSSRGAERNRVNSEFGWSKDSPQRLVMAVAADNGKVLWRHSANVAPLSLATRGESVYFYDGQHVVALNRNDGSRRWTSQPVADSTTPGTGYAPRLIAGDGVVVLSTRSGLRGRGRLVGISAQTGGVLWHSPQLKSGHWSPEDLYLIDGAVWTAQTGGSQTQGTRFQAVDAKTGQTRHDFVARNLEVFFMHQRCYPGRATQRFIMTSGTGTEFLELGTQSCELHHWVRGACIYGIMPCNGLLYKTPDSCACFYQSKLPHLCALAPASERSDGRAAGKAAVKGRLKKGPAYGAVKTTAAAPAARSWPTYRRDNARSGASKTPIADKLSTLWRAQIGGKLSTITAAGGKLFAAAVDRHTIYALAADSGKQIWSFTAGGRIDGPPTIHRGLALFGCADGRVYCLRASDGTLVWRYLAAPRHQRLACYGQVESVWPLHASLLVRDGVAYCLAGRNMFIDGGMRLVRLDCATGKLLSVTVLDDRDPRTGENLQTLNAGKAIPVANADLLSCHGDSIYMGSERFSLQGKRVELDLVRGKERDQSGPGRHLFCPTGFLDDAWFHRSYWIYGKNAGEGHGEYPVPRGHTPCGRIMVFDETRVYGFISENLGNNINPRTSYTLYAADKDAVVVPDPSAPKPTGKKARRQSPRTRLARRWELPAPAVLANAMVLAGGNLFLAGPPDVADEEQTYGFVYGADDELHRQLRRQEQAWQGAQGALLWVVSAETGEKLSEMTLPAIPVWDGMIAAEGRLYAALKDGTILCLGGK